MDTITFVPLEKIVVNEYQPAEFVDQAKVLEIADSLRRYRNNGQKGLLQIPLARRVNGVYEQAFGRHRLLAFQHLAKEDSFWSEMPLIEKPLSDEEMFELMGLENFQRRDISPIEKARIFQDYMARFGKTSVQAAERFGTTEEQVRGTVRLLNLPAPAQQALREGKITITAARALLSMQKIATEKAVVETVKDIQAGRNEYGQEETPEQTIERRIGRLEEVVDMWDDNRDGKPRSNWTAGWLLSMKNFPNKFLPYLTPVDLAIALGIQNSQRTIAAANTYKMSKTGEIDLDERQAATVDEALTDEQRTRIDVLLDPPACSACPFYTRVRGSHFCGMKTCHTRKTEAWKENAIQAATRDLGIPLYDEKADGKYQVLDYGHEKLFAARNKDLRLIRRDKVRGYHSQHDSTYKGVNDDFFLVVMVGKTFQDQTQALREATAQERAQETAENQKREMLGDSRERLYWEATAWLKVMFEGLNPAALETLFSMIMFDDDMIEGVEPPGKGATAEELADFRRRSLAFGLLEEKDTFVMRRTWAAAGTAAKVAEWVGETAKAWGVELPRAFFKIAEGIDGEIAGVTVETVKGKKGKK